MLHINTILHPTDFSETAGQALEVAHALARDHGGKLLLVAVPQPLTNISSAVEQELYLGVPGVAQCELERMATKLTDVAVGTQVLTEPVGPAIVAAAQASQADLIVMGTHGRTGINRLLMGSVAEYVLRHANCPVLTIKPGMSNHMSQDEEPAPSENTSSSIAAVAQ